MLVKYVGSRPFLSVVLSGRQSYYFDEVNNFTVEVNSLRHVNELLRSTQHMFEIVVEAEEKPKEKKVEVKEEKPKKKKRGRRKKNA